MDGPHGAALSAEGFGLKGPRGWTFRDVTFSAGPGSLVAVEGPSGSGRTCLLLALTGRMRSTQGRAEVGGERLPGRLAAVRGFSALGPVPGVSELDPSLTVAEHLRERALLRRRFDGSLRSLLHPRAERAAARAAVETALETAGLDLADLPKAERTSVRDLERLEALRLSVALALMGRPRLLAVDDTDLKLSAQDRALAWDLLRGLADAGTTVLAVCSEAPEGALVVRTRPAEDDSAPIGTAAEEPTGATAEEPNGATAGDREASRSGPVDPGAARPGPGEAAPATADDTTTRKDTADAIAETGRA
ncbi:ATP-binding cassette domain-containing protein [Streptomyces sp. NPDC006288]|uniref:ATP-binding cassette domain-containing protein n=1 Tax=Streptomyces sp. NPDC006288 TaxID=3156743 RepID=UPI0033ADB79A